MESATQIDEENQSLRRCVRDLVALSMLSTTWDRAAPREIAEALTDVVLGTLDVDLVYVRLTGEDGSAAGEVARTERGLEPACRAREVGKGFAPLIGAGGPVAGATLDGPWGGPPLRAAVAPLGFGAECGSLAAASMRRDFPTRTDRLLLGVAANQAAMVLQRRRAETGLRESEAQYRLLAENSSDLISRHDPEGRYLYASPACLPLLGYGPEEMVGRLAEEFVHPEDHARARDVLEFRSGATGPRRGTFRLRRKCGAWAWFEASSRAVLDPETGKAREFQCATRDVSERVRAEDEVRHLNGLLSEQASTDELTGLKNRRRFRERFESAVAHSACTGQPLSVVLLDVDHFKQYNDSHGHQAGDDVLRRVGEVLRDKVRPSDLAARYGGEEFVLLLPGADARTALAVADRVRAAVASYPWPLRPVTASLGVATLPSEGLDGAGLIAAADKALYHSKAQGRDRVTHFAAFPVAPAASFSPGHP